MLDPDASNSTEDAPFAISVHRTPFQDHFAPHHWHLHVLCQHLSNPAQKRALLPSTLTNGLHLDPLSQGAL